MHVLVRSQKQSTSYVFGIVFVLLRLVFLFCVVDPAIMNEPEAKKEFDWIDTTFVPIAQAKEPVVSELPLRYTSHF